MVSRMAVPVYLISGDDEFLVAQKSKQVIDELVPLEERALGLETIEGKADTVAEAVSAVARCREAVMTMGFFGGRKVTWFRDVNFLSDTVVGRSESVKEAVADLAALIKEGFPEGQILVVSAVKADKRYAFYKACKAAGEVHEFTVPDKAYLAERQAGDVLGGVLEQAGLQMSRDVKAAFIEKVGFDTRRIVGEVDKLAVYLGKRKRVESADLEAVTSASRGSLAWDLADAFGKRQLPRALGILRQLLFQKESPIGLIIGLESRIRDLIVYREALDNRWLEEKRGYGGRPTLGWGDVPPEVDEMLSEGFAKDPRSTHPFRIGLLAQQAANFSASELEECRRAATEAHVELVSSAVPQPMILELLLIRMLSKQRKPVRATSSG